MMRLALCTAAAVLVCLHVSPSQAQYFGDAPWCAVIQIGSGGVHWDCQYATVEACVPNVLAGNRGFCGMNPYYRSGYQTGYRPGYQTDEWQASSAPHYRHYPRYRAPTHSHKHSHSHNY